jgi:hypothetical protein
MATCSVSYTPAVTGKHLITGSYSGDSGHAKSSGGFAVNVRPAPGGSVLLTFNGFDVDDFDNGVGQFQVLINGQLVVDIPAGLNHLTGSGDYTSYTDRWVKFGPFDVTSLVVQGQNTIVFMDPLSSHFGLVRNTTIVQGSTILLQVHGAGTVYPGHSVNYTFSIQPLVLTSFSVSSTTPAENQAVTFTATYTGGTAPFRCTFNFGDDESVTVAGVAGTCSVAHDYDSPGNFAATVTVKGSSTSDKVSGSIVIAVSSENDS